MYGMVNNAVREHAIAHWGDAAWADIAGRAGVDAEGFAAMNAYPDSVTLDLLGAAAAVSGKSVEDVLRDVGFAWVGYAYRTSFSSLLRMAGDDPASVLENLDAMHSQIQLSLPALVMPRFEVTRQGDGAIGLLYRSQRAGLFPFVEGLLNGLAAHFGQTLRIEDHAAIDAGSARWTLRFAASDTAAA